MHVGSHTAKLRSPCCRSCDIRFKHDRVCIIHYIYYGLTTACMDLRLPYSPEPSEVQSVVVLCWWFELEFSFRSLVLGGFPGGASVDFAGLGVRQAFFYFARPPFYTPGPITFPSWFP